MDADTFAALENRVSRLENILSINDSSSARTQNSVQEQILELKKEVDSVFMMKKELKTLLDIGDDFHIEPKDSKDDAEKNVFSSNIAECESPAEPESSRYEKMVAFIQLNSETLHDALGNSEVIKQFDVAMLCNFHSDIQAQLLDFNDHAIQLLRREHAIEQIAKISHLLTLQSVLQIDRYIKVIHLGNEFWLNSSRKLANLSQLLSSIEKTHQYLHKY